jgi:hypothetical protein
MYYLYYWDCKIDICPIFMFANSIKKKRYYGIISTTQYVLILFNYYVDFILNFRCYPVVINYSISSINKCTEMLTYHIYSTRTEQIIKSSGSSKPKDVNTIFTFPFPQSTRTEYIIILRYPYLHCVPERLG